MRNFVKYLAFALICGALSIPAADARGRNNNERGRRTEKTVSTAHKPGNRDGRKNDHKNNDRHKPSTAPGNGHSGNHAARPGNGHNHAQPQPPQAAHNRPQAPNPGPAHSHNAPRPGHRPSYHHVPHGRPQRPFMPAHRPYTRPTPPPPAWRPGPWQPFRSVLGVAFGTALGMSINYLVNGGYDVSGYDNDMVYLSNVPMLNLVWPAANLYYNATGGLAGSQFVYYTPRRSMKRFNDVYRTLVRSYGSPYSVRNLAGGGRIATWWGADGQYITLNCGTDIAGNGTSHFYTTLSFGM